MTEKLAAFLYLHRLERIDCDEATSTDRPVCGCGADLGRYPMVGIAAYAWATHVAKDYERVDPAFLEKVAQEARGELPDGRPIR